MLIDSKGKLFGKISVIDILVLLIIIGAIGGIGYKFVGSYASTSFSEKDRIQVVFSQNLLADVIVDSIEEGEPVRDRVQGTSFGNVKEVKRSESKQWVETADGKVVLSSKPEYSSVDLVVEGKGTYSDTSVRIGTSDYFIGNQLEIRVGNTAYWVRIDDIKKLD